MYLNFENLKNKKFIMAGPNVIESEEQILMMATKLKQIFSNYNVNFIFKTSFDKANRTSASSYRGLGFREGLRILKKVKDEIKVPIITDIHESWQAGPVGEIVDVIQIRNIIDRMKNGTKENNGMMLLERQRSARKGGKRKGRKKKRLRSRNKYVDTHLESESGDDAYADLEDFIVGEDDEID